MSTIHENYHHHHHDDDEDDDADREELHDYFDDDDYENGDGDDDIYFSCSFILFIFLVIKRRITITTISRLNLKKIYSVNCITIAVLIRNIKKVFIYKYFSKFRFRQGGCIMAHSSRYHTKASTYIRYFVFDLNILNPLFQKFIGKLSFCCTFIVEQVISYIKPGDRQHILVLFCFQKDIA